jgi:hypothetical protein
LQIPTVRRFSDRLVLQHGGSLVQLNPRDLHLDGIPEIGIAAGALLASTAIDARLAAERA